MFQLYKGQEQKHKHLNLSMDVGRRKLMLLSTMTFPKSREVLISWLCEVLELSARTIPLCVFTWQFNTIFMG